MAKQPIRKRIAEANHIDTVKSEYTLVIDGCNLLKIALSDKRMNNKGESYGGIYVFLKKLGEVLSKKDFNYCVVCWDGIGSGVLRWRIYSDYKANRDKRYDLYESSSQTAYDKGIADYCKKVLAYSHSKKQETQRGETDDESFDRQKAILQSILEELCIRQFEYEDCEGDDLISNYIINKNDNEKIVIVSSDKDLTQLISDKVVIFNPRTKEFITKDNSVEKLGIRHDNIVTEKILCGDASDNIKGIKGVGEATLLKFFPQLRENHVTVEFITEQAKVLLEGRKQQKKPPLKVLGNIVNKITDGSQGKDIYDINKNIIDLSYPLLTEEARASMSEEIHEPIDVTERELKNVYSIVKENGMRDLMEESRFGEILAPYGRIRMMEKRRFEEFVNNSKKS